MAKQKFKGQVVKRTYAESSKSEHEAIMLDTGKHEYKLRRVKGSPFVDEVLEELVGKQVECEGIKRGTLLIIKDWKEIQEKSKKKKKKTADRKTAKKKTAGKKKKATSKKKKTASTKKKKSK